MARLGAPEVKCVNLMQMRLCFYRLFLCLVLAVSHYQGYPDSKVHGAHTGPTWGRQDPGGPQVGHMNLAIWVILGLRPANERPRYKGRKPKMSPAL